MLLSLIETNSKLAMTLAPEPKPRTPTALFLQKRVRVTTFGTKIKTVSRLKWHQD
jgi:hypothetical protein